MIFATGDIYEGYWKNGTFDGFGRMISNPNRLYEGQWKAGKKQGKGNFYYQNGDRYDGNFI
jgi:hypothetical protein